jgi:long-chain acyl-CoA synthetase
MPEGRETEEQPVAAPEGTEGTNGAQKDGKRALAAAGVTAAVLGGAALAVGVARSREGQAWSRMQEEIHGTAGARRQAGDLARSFPEITVPQMLRRTAEQSGPRTALKERVRGRWVTITYAELAERVMSFALGLAELGVGRGDRVALLSDNRTEWAIADLAVLSLGAANVPLYATLPPPQVEHIVRDSGACVLIVEDEKQLKKVEAVREHLPDLRHLVLIEPGDAPPPDTASFSAVEEIGANRPNRGAEYERRWHAVQPHDLASIIYTSGTTGLPKGAMLTHDNFMSNAQCIPTLIHFDSDDLFLSFLPLAHVFARIAGHYLPLLTGSQIVYTSLRDLKKTLAESEPTVAAFTPRIFESIQEAILEGVAKRPPKERKLFEWALQVGARHNGPKALGKSPGLITRAEYALADRLVLSKLRKKIAGERLRFFIAGGAPLGMDTTQFYTAVGWTMLQGYGLTETSPVIAINRPELNKFGTVGPPIPAVEVRIADDGEILCRGPNIMQGYFNLPEETAKAIDEEGWFHTGDVGQIDADGYLQITDRKKDLIVLANGKNVAPQPIESALKASPFIGWAALFGDKQAQVVALLVPTFDRLKAWAAEQGLPTEPLRALLDRPEVRQLYKKEIDANTKQLADYEKVRRFALLDQDFSIDGGELTPTLKVKRRVLAERYGDVIAGLYQGGSE